MVNGQQVSFQFRNEGFFLWARPHKDFRRGVHVSTPQAEKRGERSPEEKGPFLDGN
jgi:hypothetical protein